MITYQEFINKYNGKGTDWDGRYGVQCVDLAKVYLKEVFNITAGYWGDAHAYFDNFSSHKELTSAFTRITNTADFVPKKGDIVIWSSKLNGGPGHIAIASGQGDKKYFYSYDQNWTGNHDKCKLVKHTYNCVLGVLRPKDQAKITTAVEFKVKVICNKLNVRKTPKFVNSDIVTTVKKNQIYTIVGEKTVDGVKFGKLKSGVGYISLGSKYVKKV